jgi:hypothetical protein
MHMQGPPHDFHSAQKDPLHQWHSSPCAVAYAFGGSVAIDVDGFNIQVVTTQGESALLVLQNLAAAINADADLQALGTTAEVHSGILITNGTLGPVMILDGGLSGAAPLVPALSPVLLGLLALIMASIGLRRLAPINSGEVDTQTDSRRPRTKSWVARRRKRTLAN